MGKIYVGYTPKGIYEVFRSTQEPTRETHGHLYDWCMGPFQTMRGANFYRDYGKGNPHTTTVSACEKLAKLYAHGTLKHGG